MSIVSAFLGYLSSLPGRRDSESLGLRAFLNLPESPHLEVEQPPTSRDLMVEYVKAARFNHLMDEADLVWNKMAVSKTHLDADMFCKALEIAAKNLKKKECLIDGCKCRVFE